MLICIKSVKTVLNELTVPGVLSVHQYRVQKPRNKLVLMDIHFEMQTVLLPDDMNSIIRYKTKDFDEILGDASMLIQTIN